MHPPTNLASGRRPRIRSRLRRTGAACALVVGVGSVAPVLELAAGTQPSASATLPVLRASSVGKYGVVLANSARRSLYLLTTEIGAKIHCKSTCVYVWRPLLVAAGTRHISIGALG